jgi:hypothetical protein
MRKRSHRKECIRSDLAACPKLNGNRSDDCYSNQTTNKKFEDFRFIDSDRCSWFSADLCYQSVVELGLQPGRGNLASLLL